jgi:hypothetical protein
MPATLWYVEPNAISNAIGYAKHPSRSHNKAVIRFMMTLQRRVASSCRAKH